MALRTRLTLSFTVFFAAALLLLGIGIYTAVQQALYQGVVGDLHAGAKQVLTLYQAGGSNSLDRRLDLDKGQLLILPRGEVTQIFNNPMLIAQVRSVNGELLGRSPNMQDQELPLPSVALDLEHGQTWLGQQTVQGVNLYTRIEPLLVEITIDRPDGRKVIEFHHAGYLQISRPMKDIEMTLGLLLSMMLSGGAITLFVTAAGVFVLSRSAVKPIDQVTRTAQSIVRAEDLSRRVEVPHSQDELQRLTVTINEMLGRMEALFHTQRRFVADVSHELRTPLTAMQGNMEILTRSVHNNPDIFHESLTDMRRETTRMIRMVNDLLLLAQSESGVQIRQESVELDTLLLEVHRELRLLAGDVKLRIGAEDQVTITGDRDRIKQALLNLGVNALQHTAPGGLVTLSLERRNGYACLSVADTGEGIAPEDVPHIFDRFYRADRSRSRHGGGAGLGLAIVKRIANAHNGHVTVASVPRRGSTFALWLPPDATPPPQAQAAQASPVIDATSIRPASVES
ncbi:MAG: HAMP domain-containing histidine kinase [Chloroflexales bacterium]|nr:HAMP domain-containing histidine kinase [Chloroflexales bacterium]